MIDICLTVDVEFCINRSLGLPDERDPVGAKFVLREVDGRSEGLGALLEPLSRLDLPATFFIETFQQHYFGPNPMGTIVDRIRAMPRQDLQLHLHPCWRYFKDPEWRRHTRHVRHNDAMAGRGNDTETLIAEGAALFQGLRRR